MSYVVRKATAADALQIQHFNAKIGVDQIPPNTNWSSFLIGENEEKHLVSIIRIQTISERVGLFRSLVVDTKVITPLFILEFLEATLYYAKEIGLTDIFILTSTENNFLQSLGFKKVNPHLLPQALTETNAVQDHIEKKLPILMKSESIS